tara:strand:+ start:583 stop:699 length:117 start_codon:yes stop_codon:yes gene_type:complete
MGTIRGKYKKKNKNLLRLDNYIKKLDNKKDKKLLYRYG